MQWSWRLGRAFGIDVFVHATFLLLLAWVAVGAYLRERTVNAVASGVAFIVLVFGSVVLHELGHALMARRFGIKTRDITLLPIGGVARLERNPDKPWQEFLVALAGPAVSAVIAAVLFVLLRGPGRPFFFNDPNLIVGPLLIRLMWVNASIAVFNLLPAFPMDGGRALRALLALRGDYVRATRTAAQLGRGIALLLGLLGLFTNPMLVFIAVFVWLGAAAEAGAVQRESALAGLSVHAAMVTDFHVVSARDSLRMAADVLLAGSQIQFPVVDEKTGSLVGVLTRADIVRGLAGHGPGSPIAAAMSRYEAAYPNEKVSDAMRRAEASGSLPLLVVRDGRPVGMIMSENLTELMMVDDAIRASARSTGDRMSGGGRDPSTRVLQGT